ncbi:efflux transporter outer membrane subunit [Stutzerimonas sp. NM35]
MHKPLLSLLASAILLAGCSLAPVYEEPALGLPAQWDAELEQGLPLTPDWWTLFGSGELDRLVRQAQDGNLDLATAMSRVRQADIQARIAGASLLPILNGNLGGNRSDIESGTSATRYSAGLSASYELDVWGHNRDALASSELNAQASAYERDSVALTVDASVATSYFKVLELRERLRLAEENLRVAEQVMSMVDAKVRLGAGSELDRVQQQTLVEQRRAALPGLRQQVATAETALALLLGEAPQGIAARIRAGSLDELLLPDPVATGLPSELLLRRPDLRRAETQLRAANVNIGVTRAALFPSISLSASASLQDAALSGLSSADLATSIGASLLQPIFRGGALRGQVDLSEERYVELVAGYRQSILTALKEVEDALVTVREGQLQYASQRQVLVNAERTFELAQIQYRAGASDLLTVLSAQQTLFSARDTFLQNTSSQLLNQVSLYKTLGGGFVAPQG